MHVLVVVALVATGCGAVLSASGGAIRAKALKPRRAVSGPLFASLAPREIGIAFREAAPGAPDPDPEELGAGIAASDVDGDGRTDLFFVSRRGPDALYRNRGGFEFEDMTGDAGVAGPDAPSSMALFADVDRDGDPDLYVLADGAPNRLYLNEGRWRFRENAKACGLAFTGASRAAAFSDYDRDGDLDLYLVTREPPRPGAGVSRDAAGGGHLFRNDGRGRFREVTRLTPGMGTRTLPAASVLWWDRDGDGWQDLFLSGVPGRGEREVRNLGDTHFIAAGEPPSLPVVADSRGADCADVNGDGLLDLAVAGRVSQLLVNTGAPPWIDAGLVSGLSALDGSRGLRWGDLDLDGREDLVMTGAAGLRVSRGSGDLLFVDTTESWGLESEHSSDGALLTDLDRDGDLDIVVNRRGDVPGVYRNDGSRGHALELRLVGHVSDRSAVGARVEIESASRGRQVRVVSPARGWMSCDEALVHFGTGEDSLVTRLVVSWPSGATQEFHRLATNRLYVLEEGAAHVKRVHYAGDAPGELPRPATRFADAGDSTGLDVARAEARRAEGPGIAVGDVDGDGDEDVFTGGAAGQPGTLYLNDGGRYRRAASGAWEADAGRDDAGCLLVDADGDDDLDLYVASGGEDCAASSPLLQDRLYLNDGHGNFRAATREALPVETEAGGAVAAADFDRDGDLDLFVAGRNVPQHPEARPRSLLLVRGGSRYHEANERVAPGLASAGRVTGALWSDADDDGWVDLLLTTEGGPVRCFRNLAGELIDATAAAGLADVRGDWTGIAALDLEADGDMDYVVTQAPHAPGVGAGGDTVPEGSSVLVNDGDARFECRPLPRLARAAAGAGLVSLDADGDGWSDLFSGVLLLGRPAAGATAWRAELASSSGIPFLPGARAIALTDADGNGVPDLLVTMAQGVPRLFTSVARAGERRAMIRVSGMRGNHLAIGARVRVTTRQGRHHLAEVAAGSGYLAQSTTRITFGLTPGDALATIDVRWPDGSTERVRAEADSVVIAPGSRRDA